MPFIDTKLNIRLTEEKEAILKERLGQAVSIFPGKTEYWLMLHFSDNQKLWFRGYNNFPMAMVEVKLFGAAEEAVCSRMTRVICELFQEVLGIAPDHVYVKYEFCDRWGWNKENF